jgi:hypothetical protein
VILLSAGLEIAAQPATVPAPSDYAWGFPIHTDSESSFYSVQLPLEVHQSVTDTELRDAGVYNADGDPVPRIFRPVSDDVERVEHLVQLPFLPLHTSAEDRVDDIRLVFERDGDKTRLELNADDVLEPTASDELSSYIVDTRQLKQSIEALELRWSPVSSGFIGTAIIEGSNNLKSWSSLGTGAVADLQQESTSVVQRRVPLQKSDHDFLRVRWKDLPEDWRLTAVQGEYILGVRNVVRETVLLTASAVDPDDGGRIFSLGGAPGVDRVRVVLPESNTVMSARIYHWSERQQRWIQTAADSFHHIGRGDQSLKSGPLRIARVRTSRFKVLQSSGRPDLPIQLEIGWRPDSLLFLAQGSPPFTLVAGRVRDADDGFPQQRIYGDRSIVNLAADDGRASAARLGPRYSLGGAESLRDSPAPDWRKVALWLGLTLGVAFVGVMAVRVVRDLKTA